MDPSSWVLYRFAAVEYFIFYSDLHDVDEGINTIPKQGGKWPDTNAVGMMFRAPYDSPATVWDTVAPM